MDGAQIPHPSQPYVFVSYSSLNQAQVLGIVDALEARGVPVWIDRQSIVGGRPWTAEIVAGVEGAAVVLLMCTSVSVSSRNVQQELQLAWESNRNIVPVMLETVQLPGQVRYMLAGRQWIDVAGRPEHEWLPQLLDALRSAGVNREPPAPPPVDCLLIPRGKQPPPFDQVPQLRGCGVQAKIMSYSGFYFDQMALPWLRVNCKVSSVSYWLAAPSPSTMAELHRQRIEHRRPEGHSSVYLGFPPSLRWMSVQSEAANCALISWYWYHVDKTNKAAPLQLLRHVKFKEDFAGYLQENPLVICGDLSPQGASNATLLVMGEELLQRFPEVLVYPGRSESRQQFLPCRLVGAEKASPEFQLSVGGGLERLLDLVKTIKLDSIDVHSLAPAPLVLVNWLASMTSGRIRVLHALSAIEQSLEVRHQLEILQQHLPAERLEQREMNFPSGLDIVILNGEGGRSVGLVGFRLCSVEPDGGLAEGLWEAMQSSGGPDKWIVGQRYLLAGRLRAAEELELAVLFSGAPDSEFLCSVRETYENLWAAAQ